MRFWPPRPSAITDGAPSRFKLAVYCLVSLLIFLSIAHFSHVETPRLLKNSIPKIFQAPKCAPADWSAGRWIRKENPKPVIVPDDVFEASGFLGCASNREVQWHLANDHPDELPWRGNISAWYWEPGPACYDVRDSYAEDMVAHLVEEGGWLLIGDSVTQEHFFSISCTLYPHVRATPDYSKDWGFDRAWPQNLYLRKDSSVLDRITLPVGFDVDTTPLVTFRRNDLLFNQTEIAIIESGGSWYPGLGVNSTLWGDEAAWTISPTEYINDIFLAPLPQANYQTLIVSTAGHWSLHLFEGLHNGYPEIFDLFRMAMTNWVYQAAKALDSEAVAGRKKEIVVRPYLPGDDNCHSRKVMDSGPVTTPMSKEGASYNWQWIPWMNTEFQKIVDARAHPHLHYVDTELPGRLRPDAHVLGDCLHITIGAGVIEGWTQYIYYYLSTYLPWERARSTSFF